MKILHQINNGIMKILTFVSCAYLVYIVFACAMQVFSRYVLNSSFAWTEETARYAFASMGMLSAPIVLDKGMHVNVDILESRLSGKALLIHKLIIHALLLVISYVLLRYGVVLFNNIGGTYSPALKIPIRAVYFTVPVCGLVSIWVILVHMLDTILVKWRSNEEKN